MKLIIEIDTKNLGPEEIDLFLRESKKATGVKVEVGRPSRTAKVRGFGDVELVADRTTGFHAYDFTARLEK
jgi:hypothetical protein